MVIDAFFSTCAESGGRSGTSSDNHTSGDGHAKWNKKKILGKNIEREKQRRALMA
jgi:hypothetical protein